MNKVFAVLSALLVAAVSAEHLVFDGHLVTHGDTFGRLAVLHHVGHVEPTPDVTKKLRFLYLVPKLTAYLDDGFGSHDVGSGKQPVHHAFLDLDKGAGEHLVELLGFSDCATWHGVLLGVWHVDKLVHKAVTGVKEHDKFVLNHLGGVDVVAELADFVHAKVKGTHVLELVKKGLASHHLTHLLHEKVKHLA